MDVFRMEGPNERAERGPKKGMRKDLSLERARSLPGMADGRTASSLFSALSSERRRRSLHTLHPLNGANIARGNILHDDGILKLRARRPYICDVRPKMQK